VSSCRIGAWWTKRQFNSEPVVVRLPIKPELPEIPKEDKSWWWRFTHKKAKVDTEYIYEYTEEEKLPDWFATRWWCFDLERYKDGSGIMWLRRENTIKKVPFENVPPAFKMTTTDTEKGYELSSKRFSNPIKWTGVSLLNETSLLPYITTSFGIKTGCSFWRFTFEGYYKNREMIIEQKRERDNVIGISSELRIW